MQEFEEAKDKLLMGAERRSMAMNEHEKINTAYHEAGHAIVGKLVPEHDPVYKVSIIPRGRALGVTMYLPEQDRVSQSRRGLLSNISTLFAGRIAEEMMFGADAVTTGASNDIERATMIARNMVTRWGFSKKLAPMQYEKDNEGSAYLGGASSSMVAMSDKTAATIDEEVTEIINSCYQKAVELLEANKDILENMKDALLKYETIDADQIDDLMNRREVRAPAKHDDKSSVGSDNNEAKTEDNSSDNDNSSEDQKPLENDDVRIDSEDKSQDSSEKEDK
jgi:cell division protease FtsH